MKKKKLEKVIQSCYSKSDVCRALEIPINGTGMRKVKALIKEHEISTDHFDPYKTHKDRRKYQRVKKECPVCNETFQVRKGSPKEKVTCSSGCANTHFRSGPNNPNWNDDQYRTTCFHYHPKECVVCGEHRIVAVHHYDEDRSNNSPENLIPICSTHHDYVHSRYAHLVMDIINAYRDEFIARMKEGKAGVDPAI